MKNARFVFLTIIAVVAANTMIGLACNSTQNNKPIIIIVTSTVHEDHTPQPSTPTTETFVVHGESGTTQWWCENQYCYKTSLYYTTTVSEEKCFRVERIPLFDTTDYATITDKAGLIEELIADGKSNPCTRTGPE